MNPAGVSVPHLSEGPREGLRRSCPLLAHVSRCWWAWAGLQHGGFAVPLLSLVHPLHPRVSACPCPSLSPAVLHPRAPRGADVPWRPGAPAAARPVPASSPPHLPSVLAPGRPWPESRRDVHRGTRVWLLRFRCGRAEGGASAADRRRPEPVHLPPPREHPAPARVRPPAPGSPDCPALSSARSTRLLISLVCEPGTVSASGRQCVHSVSSAPDRSVVFICRLRHLFAVVIG